MTDLPLVSVLLTARGRPSSSGPRSRASSRRTTRRSGWSSSSSTTARTRWRRPSPATRGCSPNACVRSHNPARMRSR